jgi:hypothetical protein
MVNHVYEGRFSYKMHLDVFVAMPGVAYMLSCGWGNCTELLLPASNSIGVGVLTLHALFICLSVLGWYIPRDDQDLVI